MTFTRIVLLQFKADTSAEAIKNTCSEFLNLKEKCTRPITHVPYILSLTGGTVNSNDGLQNGLTHSFVVEFATLEDHEYYLKTDPHHQDLSTNYGPFLEKVVSVNYTPGVFEAKNYT